VIVTSQNGGGKVEEGKRYHVPENRQPLQSNAGLKIPHYLALQTPGFSPCAARSHDM